MFVMKAKEIDGMVSQNVIRATSYFGGAAHTDARIEGWT